MSIESFELIEDLPGWQMNSIDKCSQWSNSNHNWNIMQNSHEGLIQSQLQWIAGNRTESNDHRRRKRRRWWIRIRIGKNPERDLHRWSIFHKDKAFLGASLCCSSTSAMNDRSDFSCFIYIHIHTSFLRMNFQSPCWSSASFST